MTRQQFNRAYYKLSCMTDSVTPQTFQVARNYGLLLIDRCNDLDRVVAVQVLLYRMMANAYRET